ncbi:MAG: hypothetical protein ACOYO1_11715 [Bacteroidales bacterium]
MKKLILIIFLTVIEIVAYSQERPQNRFIIGECTGLSSFTNWRKDYQREGIAIEVQLERLIDSSFHSSLMRFSSAYFKSKNTELSKNKFFTSFQTIERAYISKKSLFKAYLQLGILETLTYDNIEIGALIGGGLHIGKFRKNNLSIEINHVWHSGGYNYINLQIGFSCSLEYLF